MRSYDLYNDDCLTVMPKLPDKSIDMVLCDLPYGTTRNKWDSIIPMDKLWEQYLRLIKDNGVIVLFGDGMFTANMMLSNAKMWRYNLVWDKMRGTDFLNANRKPMKSHEDVMVFYKKMPKYNPQKTEGKPYVKSKNAMSSNWGKFEPHTIRNYDGMRYPLSVLRFTNNNSTVNKGMHPTQKPVELCEWLVKTYTDEGDLVLDNCMGSGTTGVAALANNRRFIGIESDTKYFDTAQRRISKLLSQQKRGDI